ncbi:hypothetical protein PRZ48_006751 [Zasmidium cellare]|uniref:Uncharacterized protein n=1 Tax=Zasmidium cellare TaxID=395010 RepID=A0ABR0EHH2_ZASCE|nr:hypothetical protein PRZ48_006751 [Zasmidium cellare]
MEDDRVSEERFVELMRRMQQPSTTTARQQRLIVALDRICQPEHDTATGPPNDATTTAGPITANSNANQFDTTDQHSDDTAQQSGNTTAPSAHAISGSANPGTANRPGTSDATTPLGNDDMHVTEANLRLVRPEWETGDSYDDKYMAIDSLGAEKADLIRAWWQWYTRPEVNQQHVARFGRNMGKRCIALQIHTKSVGDSKWKRQRTRACTQCTTHGGYGRPCIRLNILPGNLNVDGLDRIVEVLPEFKCTDINDGFDYFDQDPPPTSGGT